MPTRASTREELKERVPQITAPDLLAMGSFLLETDNVSPPSISSISFPEVNHSFLQVLPMCTHCIVSEFPKCIFRGKGKSCEQCQTGKRSKCTFNVSPGQLIQATDLLAAATRGSKFGKSMNSFPRFLLTNSFHRIRQIR